MCKQKKSWEDFNYQSEKEEEQKTSEKEENIQWSWSQMVGPLFC